MNGMLELFKVGASLVLDKSGFDSDIRDADAKGKGLADSLEKSFKKVQNFLKNSFWVGVAFKATQAIWNLAKSASEAGDRIDKQSQALGMSRKAFQEWDYILLQSGASIDDLGLTMKTMSAAITENSADTAAGLSKLGLSAAQLQNMSAEEQFETLVKAFQEMPEGVEKSQLALQLFGRNAQSLMPLLNSASGSVDELRNRAYDLGLIMSDEDVDAAAAFDDALDDLNAVWTALKNKFGAQLLPGFTKGLITLANSLGRISNALTKAFKEGDWKGLFSTITEEISALLPQAIDAISGMILGLFENADKIIDLGISLVNGIVDGIAKAAPALIAKLPQILSKAWESIKSIGLKLGNVLIDAINGVLGTNIPHLDEIKWPTWPEVQLAFTKAWDFIQDEAEKLMKLIFGETEDGGIDWPSPEETWKAIATTVTTWWGTISDTIAGACSWVLQMFGMPEVDAQLLEEGVSNWFSGFVNTIVDACSWVLGLFGLPTDVDETKLREDVNSWFIGFANVIQAACNWLLPLFGVPDEDVEHITQLVGDWFSGLTSVVSDACQWVLGLFGLPTNVDNEKLKTDVGNWFSTISTVIVDACNWLLGLFGLPEVNAETLKTDVSNWFSGFVDTIVDACSWFLGLFGLPTDVNHETLKADVEKWFSGLVGTIVEACNWLLKLFGLPEVDVQQLKTDVTNWFTGFVDTIVDACSWFLGLFGLPTDVNLATLSEDVAKWWSGISGTVIAACDWVLQLFGLPKVSEAVQAVKDWWFGTGEDGDNGVRGQIADFLKSTFGIDLPDTAEIVSRLNNWWNNTVLPLLTFGLVQPGGNSEWEGWETEGPPEGWDGTYSFGDDGKLQYNAKGLNYVPYDGYRTVLHRGEAVLNASQGREWRQNGGGAGIDFEALAAAVSGAVAEAVSNIQLNMDGKAVGSAVAGQVSREITKSMMGRRVPAL